MKRRLVLAAVILAAVAVATAIAIARCRGCRTAATAIPTARVVEGTAEGHSPRDRRAARRPHDHARHPARRRHAAHRAHADQRACRSKGGEIGDGVRSRRSAIRARAGEVRARRSRAGNREDEAPTPTCRRAQDDVALLTARFDVRAAELDAIGQRVHRRDRRAEERAVARGSAAPARAARRGRQVARGDQPGVARRRRGETQQGPAVDAARAAADRQPGAQGADRRHRVGQGEPRRPQHDLRPGMVIPEYREGDSVWPGRPVADVIEVGQDGSARQGRRERSRQPDDRRDGGGLRRHAAGRDVQGAASARCRASRTARSSSRARASRGSSTSSSSSTSPTRDSRLARPRASSIAGQGDSRRAARAATGGAREERQDTRLREDRRSLRAARGQGRAPDREPRRDHRDSPKAPRSRSSIRTPRRRRRRARPRRRCPQRRRRDERAGRSRSPAATSDFLPELRLGLENLRAHKLRSLLTMMGMIFGVAAVVAMLSIGAGAQQEVMAFIEQLGVRNLIVEARESTDYQVVQKVRQLSAGLTFQGLPRHPGQPRRDLRVDARASDSRRSSCCRGRRAIRRWSTASARRT